MKFNLWLNKNNTTPFTPTSDYNPATKKYVDDNAWGWGWTNEHNLLTWIQWGAVWDYYHLTQADITRLANTNWTNTWDQTISTWTITATWWQTVVTVWTYVIWNNKLQIFVNWLEQLLTTDYTETSTTSITFTSWLTAWDIVKYTLLS